MANIGVLEGKYFALGKYFKLGQNHPYERRGTVSLYGDERDAVSGPSPLALQSPQFQPDPGNFTPPAIGVISERAPAGSAADIALTAASMKKKSFILPLAAMAAAYFALK